MASFYLMMLVILTLVTFGAAMKSEDHCTRCKKSCDLLKDYSCCQYLKWHCQNILTPDFKFNPMFLIPKLLSRTPGCPVKSWSNWSQCSHTCGTGKQYREKHANCKKDIATRDCNTQACKSICPYVTWGPWGSCSKTCGGGWRHRKRDNSCDRRSESVVCNEQPCCRCSESNWGSWSDCSTTCGSGNKERTRKLCDCSVKTDIGLCNGKGGSWGSWGSCSVTCGTGSRTQYMIGADCQTKENRSTCSGQGGTWGAWSSCSVTCGLGTISRDMIDSKCNRIPDKIPCTGRGSGSWGQWSTCSVTCGLGSRKRTIIDSNCSQRVKYDECNEVPCPTSTKLPTTTTRATTTTRSTSPTTITTTTQPTSTSPKTTPTKPLPTSQKSTTTKPTPTSSKTTATTKPTSTSPKTTPPKPYPTSAKSTPTKSSSTSPNTTPTKTSSTSRSTRLSTPSSTRTSRLPSTSESTSTSASTSKPIPRSTSNTRFRSIPTSPTKYTTTTTTPPCEIPCDQAPSVEDKCKCLEDCMISDDISSIIPSTKEKCGEIHMELKCPERFTTTAPQTTTTPRIPSTTAPTPCPDPPLKTEKCVYNSTRRAVSSKVIKHFLLFSAIGDCCAKCRALKECTHYNYNDFTMECELRKGNFQDVRTEYDCDTIVGWKIESTIPCQIDPCDPNPCQNGGTCKIVPFPSRPIKRPVCTCLPRYTGDLCEVAYPSYSNMKIELFVDQIIIQQDGTNCRWAVPKCSRNNSYIGRQSSSKSMTHLSLVSETHSRNEWCIRETNKGVLTPGYKDFIISQCKDRTMILDPSSATNVDSRVKVRKVLESCKKGENHCIDNKHLWRFLGHDIRPLSDWKFKTLTFNMDSNKFSLKALHKEYATDAERWTIRRNSSGNQPFSTLIAFSNNTEPLYIGVTTIEEGSQAVLIRDINSRSKWCIEKAGEDYSYKFIFLIKLCVQPSLVLSASGGWNEQVKLQAIGIEGEEPHLWIQQDEVLKPLLRPDFNLNILQGKIEEDARVGLWPVECRNVACKKTFKYEFQHWKLLNKDGKYVIL